MKRSSQIVRLFSLAGVIGLLFSFSVRSQEIKGSRVEDQRCNVEFAKFLVDQQAAESKSVAETDKRIRILIRSADFVWNLDEPAARGYLTEAFKVATERFREKGFERKDDNGILIIPSDHRFEVVRAIARFDAEWAKKLTEQLLKDYEESSSDRKNDFNRNREIQETNSLALEALKTNPELSLHLYRRLMKYPLDYHWFFALPAVAGSDRQLADRLYAELLTVYSNETPRRLLFLSGYPFATDRPFGIDKLSYSTSLPAGYEPDLALQQRFIDLYLRRAATYLGDPANLAKPPEEHYHPEPLYILTAVQELEPIVIERFPQLMQRLSVAKAQANAALNDDMRKRLATEAGRWQNYNLGFDERIKQLEKAEVDRKLTDWMIVQLLIWDVNSRTEEQFAKIEPWLEKIELKETREAIQGYFWFHRGKRAVKDARFSDARRFAARVSEIDHRAILFFDLAEAQLEDLNEAAAVYETLTEVGRIARQSSDSVAKARVLLGLASLYEKVNHTFALNELSDAVKVINKLNDPNILSSSIMKQIRGKDFSHHSVYPVPSYDLESTFALLSKNDFDLPLSNARALEDKYLRTLAVTAVARKCIERPAVQIEELTEN